MDIDGASFSSSKNGLYEPLARGFAAIEAATERDTKLPELGDIIGHVHSPEYVSQPLNGWKPFYLRSVINIPDRIFEQYNRTECFTQMGLFSEIQRAWITVDNRLFLWDYLSGQNFQAYEDLSHTIVSVKLVQPKKNVFVEEVQCLLVIATTQEIILLGVSIDKFTGELTFYSTGMQIAIPGLNVNNIVSSKDGRIFFSGNRDPNLYEFYYQSDEGWFSRKCNKVNLTGSAIDNFVPSFFSYGVHGDGVKQIAVDDSRNLLYVLRESSSVTCYEISSSNIHRCVSYSFSSMISQAQMLNASSILLDPRSTKLVSIVPVPAYESQQIYCVAITSTGCRFYMRGGRSATSYFETSDGSFATNPPSTLQVTHIRFPPSFQTNDYQPKRQFSGSSFFPQSQSVPQQPAQDLSTQTKREFMDCSSLSTVFTFDLFFAISSSDANAGDTLCCTAPEVGRIANAWQSGSQPSLVESAMYLPIKGFVQDVKCLQNSEERNELVSQFNTPPPSFAVLTNTGVYIIVHRRPVDILASAIRMGPSSSSGIDGQVQMFFESVGRAEGCATCLGIISGRLDQNDFTASSANFAGPTTKLTQADLLEIAKKYFIEFGGKAFIDQSRYNNQYDASSYELVRLSGCHDGLASSISRLLRTVWKKPVMLTVPNSKKRVDYAPSFKADELLKIQSGLLSLSSFLESNKSFIEGLNSSDSLVGSSNMGEEIAVQAEHRALSALMLVLQQMIEGISFLLFLNESDVSDFIAITSSISPESQNSCSKLTFGEFFTSKNGREVTKELVNALVNKHLRAGGNIDLVSQLLRKRCGSFCSADDVLVFKAVESLKKAKETVDIEDRQSLVELSYNLFKKSAHVFTPEDLRLAVEEYKSLNSYVSAVNLALHVASARDDKDQALSYLIDGMPQNDTRADVFANRSKCYQYVFQILDDLESKSSEESNQTKMSVYNALQQSKDELFHYCFYDWYASKGFADRLIEIDSPYIQNYLERNSTKDVQIAILLWQYYAKREMYYYAAIVLFDLATSNLSLNLEQRIEYLTRAKGFGSCHIPNLLRQKMNKVMLSVCEQLEVASIQDDLLVTILNDVKIPASKQQELSSKLNVEILSLTELFNNFADPLGYGEICLSIFQSADYHGIDEIIGCWEFIVKTTHENAVTSPIGSSPVDSVASTLRNLTLRFSQSENVFPVEKIVALAENYSFEQQSESTSAGWVVDVFLSAGISHELIFIILNQLYDRREKPWQGKDRLLYLVKEISHLMKLWYDVSLKAGVAQAFKPNFDAPFVLEAIEKYKAVLTDPKSMSCKEELQSLELAIRRTY
ncbi:nucleoporin, WD repeat Nup155 [Schizosaccharomyces osmophilus]|uniref:Nucleoporin, WD repeat Nup155 n=1 Tax=Schizosaccharomyces osmophilus TaxID=2545709 RepID=A0AAE9WE30_9SCHI|nr:nucleoporin, WD repeat Nup155 [Schizosaccharomyces osmophilus]WBW73527.1 nucleoporin, WD repeat Nup155 [Schizosaccharomyces osmophilus]